MHDTTHTSNRTVPRQTDDASDLGGGGPPRLPPGLRRGLLIVAAVLLLTAIGAGAAVAHDNVPAEPGASGHCDSDEADGGSFAVHGPGDHTNDFADAEEARSTGDMAVYFAETQGECGGNGSQYLEVHVISAQNNVQYCYDERSDGDDGDTGRGDEPTDNVTAGAGAGEVNVNEGSRNHPPGDPENDNGERECTYDGHDSDDG